MIENKLEDLGATISSYNRIAKHYKNLEKKAGLGSADSYKYKALKEKAYRDKDRLLDSLEPVLIHRQKRNKDYILSISESSNLYGIVENDLVVEEGQYLDKEIGRVLKYKKVRITKTLNSYSLYFAVGDYRFHKPITQDSYNKLTDEMVLVNENELEKKYNLKIKDLLD